MEQTVPARQRSAARATVPVLCSSLGIQMLREIHIAVICVIM